MSGGTDVALVARTGLAIAEDQTRWTDAQLDVLHAVGCPPTATQAQLDLFFHVAKRAGLDPFARQIYMVSYGGASNGQPTIQTGIDGFRVIARRAADLAGHRLAYADTEWCGSDGQWSDVWLGEGQPHAARAVVLRDGERFSAVCLFREFVGLTMRNGQRVPNSMWTSKGAHMIGKCAEAAALRKAFPHDLSALVAPEEADHLTNPPDVVVVAQGGLPEALELVGSATSYAELVAIFNQRGPGLGLAERAQLQKACATRKAAIEADAAAPADDVAEATIVEDDPVPAAARTSDPAPAAAARASLITAMHTLGYRDTESQARLAGRLLGREVAAIRDLDPGEVDVLDERLTGLLGEPDPAGELDALLAGA